MKKFYCLMFLLSVASLFAVTGSLRPEANAFVLSPGPASPFPDANDSNFGGSGSLCVSSPTARAYDPLSGIDHQPKGEFVTLLKFDSSLCAETMLSTMTLNVAITNGNQSANKIFNFLGGAGSFDLYWTSNDWLQGYGTPKTPAADDVGVTYTTLIAQLETETPVYLETLYYDAYYSYADGENWFAYELDLSGDAYSGLRQAIQAGQTVTFMLRASEGSNVCFNLRAYVQNSSSGVVSYRDEGPFLDIQTTLPFTNIDFDNSGIIDSTDLLYIVDHWLEPADNLTADIAPLGGDGIINLPDFAEFAKYWRLSETAVE